MIAVRFGALTVACAAACLLGASGLAQEKQMENKLPAAVVKALEKAGEVEVYSLSGEEDPAGWHGWKVLGKTTVKAADARKDLAAVVVKGVTEGGKGARCFIPRHGVRAAHAGKTYDLVICFECGWVYVYTEGSDKPTVLLTSDTPRKSINKLLTDAKVKLAKPEK